MSKPTIQVLDLKFKLLIDRKMLANRIIDIGAELERAYKGKNPVFIGVLNGSFIFMADLVRACAIAMEIEFLQCSSYTGTERGAEVKVSGHFDLEKLRHRHVVIVEDIVDSGQTVSHLKQYLEDWGCASVTIVTLLLKPEVFEGDSLPKYVGFEIPNAFVVGYGLDYNGYGRELADLYALDA